MFFDEGDSALVIKIDRRLLNPKNVLNLKELIALDQQGKIGYYVISRLVDPEGILRDFRNIFEE